MKIITLTIISVLLSLNSICQDIAFFKVTNYTLNGVNYDDYALEHNIALAFYTCKDATICFSNYWRNKDTQSYGGVYALTKKEIKGTDKTYPFDEYKFTWDFINSYDDETGKALVTFRKIYIDNVVKFTAHILILGTNDIIELSGYRE